jgi:hypothetical protein
VQRQDALGEGMQGPDGGTVDGVERPFGAGGPLGRVRSPGVPDGRAVGELGRIERHPEPVRNSAPAFSVNVTAAIWSNAIPSVSTRVTTRSINDFVLPDPAPASTKIVDAVSVHPPTRVGVAERRHADPAAASMPASGSIKVTSGARTGSKRLRSQRSRATPWPRPSGLQKRHWTQAKSG